VRRIAWMEICEAEEPTFSCRSVYLPQSASASFSDDCGVPQYLPYVIVRPARDRGDLRELSLHYGASLPFTHPSGTRKSGSAMADSTTKAWQEIAKEAQDYRDASIQSVEPAVPKIPADLPLDVTDVPEELISLREAWLTQKPPEELVKWVASGKYTAISVITAFLRRAGLAQALVNGFRYCPLCQCLQ